MRTIRGVGINSMDVPIKRDVTGSSQYEADASIKANHPSQDPTARAWKAMWFSRKVCTKK